MTFTELRTEIMSRLNLTSTEAQTRLGIAINRRYKEITSSIGLVVSRRVEVQATATLGVRTLVFSNIEKINAVIDKSSGRNVILSEIPYDDMEASNPRSEPAREYSIYRMGPNTVTIYMDCIPQTAFVLYADGHDKKATLSGTDEPSFPESFHDIIVEGVLADEYRKLEKLDHSKTAQAAYDKRLSDLRMWVAKSAYLDITQGGAKHRTSGIGTGASGSSSVSNGASSWTQTGLITFDRDPLAPFAVTASSAVVPNLDADKLDGEEGSAYHNATNLNAGVVPVARLTAGVTTYVLPTSTGTQHNWAPGLSGDTLIQWAGASDLTVTGFTGGTTGQRITFFNTGTKIAWFPHESGSSLAGNRLSNKATTANTPVAPGGSLTYIYNGGVWILTAHDQGLPITVTFAAGNFTGDSSMTWTVGSGDVVTLTYHLCGKMLTVTFYLDTTTVGGTPSSTLQISTAAWGGFTAVSSVRTTCENVDNGTASRGPVGVAAAGTSINILRNAGANWTASTNNTGVQGVLVFAVT